MGNVMREYWIPFLQAEDLRRQAWVLVSHSLAVPSKPPPAASPPSRLSATARTALVCPSRMASAVRYLPPRAGSVRSRTVAAMSTFFVQTAPFPGISAADVPVRQAGILAAAQQPLAASALSEL
jgi:hypothetical protein